jgi:DNA-binding transcriptional LysR family regulator
MHMVHATPLAAVDLNLLVALRALLRERHVTRAARELGLSQSATSHALNRLRELYGDPLLVRNGRSLEPTPRALALLPQLMRGLTELEASLRGEAPFEPQRARHVFRVGCADYFQAVLFGPLLALLQAEAPGIDLQVMSHAKELERLDDGTLDVALLPKMPLPRGLSEQRLFSDGFKCMLRKGHPGLRRNKLTLETYLGLGHVLVAPSGTSGSYVDTELQRRGLTRRIALQVSSFLVAPLVVAETDLVSTAPERLLKRVSQHYPIVLLPSPLAVPRFDLSLVWHSRRQHDPAHGWLREAIVRAAREL